MGVCGMWVGGVRVCVWASGCVCVGVCVVCVYGVWVCGFGCVGVDVDVCGVGFSFLKTNSGFKNSISVCNV